MKMVHGGTYHPYNKTSQTFFFLIRIMKQLILTYKTTKGQASENHQVHVVLNHLLWPTYRTIVWHTQNNQHPHVME